MARRWAGFAVVLLTTGTAWALLVPSRLSQPVSFPHSTHRGIACAVCHAGVETAARAAIPQGDLCARCHAAAPKGVDAAAWIPVAAGRPIPWQRVTRLPDHVAFSHRRHVTVARLACESCHADIGQRAAPPAGPPLRLDMNTCLGCHRQERASEDCAACHR